MKSGACFILAACALGCGPAQSSSTPDAGTPDPAYWGLGDKICLRYDYGSGPNYTVSINIDTDKVPQKTTYHFFAHENGFPQDEKWFEPTVNALTLDNQHIPPPSGVTGDTFISFAPAPDYLAKGVTTTLSHTTHTTESSSTGSMTTTTDEQFTLNVAEKDVMVEANGGMVTATHYLLTQAPTSGTGASTSTHLWFAPNVGIVQIGRATGSNWVLKQTDQNVAPADCHP